MKDILGQQGDKYKKVNLRGCPSKRNWIKKYDAIRDWWNYKTHYYFAGVEFHESTIASWKIIICLLIGHVEDEVEVGEHWGLGGYVQTDYAPVCARCGKWL